MVEYKASKRIVGTSAERATMVNEAPHWVEVGRTTLTSAGSDITVSGFADKKYYMVLMSTLGTGSGATNWLARIGNGSVDTGSNYARRKSQDGGSDVTATSSNTFFEHFSGEQRDRFGYHYITNYATKEKLGIGSHVSANTAGAGTAPYERNEIVNKWANTSDVMDTFQLRDDGSDTYGIGSEVVVLGWDPADTSGTNFWEELASVELGSAGDTLDSGVFTAKKYLWVQWYVNSDTGNINPEIQFNSDTGSNYARRKSGNGENEGTVQSQTAISIAETEDVYPRFANMFIINNSANEKLSIIHYVEQKTAGAGTAPQRTETVAKWANTSSQISSIQIINVGSGDFGTNSIIKVWGSD